eukprot:3939792-Rhodomonas_salina.2
MGEKRVSFWTMLMPSTKCGTPSSLHHLRCAKVETLRVPIMAVTLLRPSTGEGGSTVMANWSHSS